MSQYGIQLHIIIDGIKPKLLAETFELNSLESEDGYVNSIYCYKNFGVEEIIQAVKVLKESNHSHSYYFAPYEATPQVYYLHDHFAGASMWGFPDLLFHVWYNFIIDFDLQKQEFEWVKYSKENNLNRTRNLAKMFLNLGYFLKPGEKYKELTTEEIKAEAANWTANQDYQLNTLKISNTKIWEILEYPCILSIKFEIEQLKRKVTDSLFEDLYGNKLSKETYFVLFKGLITPKVCEMLAYERIRKSHYYLKWEVETSLIRMNLSLIEKGFNILKDTAIEDRKTQEELGPFDTKGTKNAEFDNEVANFINSEGFNDTLQETSDDRINTVNLVIKELWKYIEENNKATKTKTSAKPLLFLQENQIWPYMLLHLWKEINIWKDGSLTYFGNFYSQIKDWRHDYQYLIICDYKKSLNKLICNIFRWIWTLLISFLNFRVQLI